SADVDEAFQNTCEVLWSKFEQFEPGSNFFSWACSIARFEALRILRERGRESKLFSDAFFDIVAEQATEMSDLLEAQHLALADCLAGLPARQRALIQLRYAAESSTQRVADQFNM